MLEFLRGKYAVRVASFTLPRHSKNALARVWRNGWRLARSAPPLLDRYAGFESQLAPFLEGQRYRTAVIEHFWCAPYAAVVRPNADRLVLDLHNIESELARSHASSARGLEAMAFSRFASAYRRLESVWLPKFDVVLVASEEDRRRVEHPHVLVYPNALPEIACPDMPEKDWIVFSGNFEYHPNIQGVHWFHSQVWPRMRAQFPRVEWRLAGCNWQGFASIVARDGRIRILGAMDHAIPVLAQAKVCIVPLLSGSGTRFKILEAWAAGRAVVSTTIGAEGLGARPGEHLLVADDPEEFASAIARLLESPDLRARLGAAGRALYLDRYTWASAWKRLEEAGI